jgi:Domain of unknown function (DUF4136)
MRRPIATGWVSLAALAALAAGCSWNPWIPKRRSPAFEDLGEPTAQLELGKPLRDAIDCPAGDCQDRYRVEVPEAGDLQVSVRSLESGRDIQMRVVVEGPVGVLAQSGERETSPRLDVPVRPGPHYVLVQALGGRFGYELTATLRPGAGAPAAAPRVPGAPSLTPSRPREVPPTVAPGSNYDPSAITLFPKWRSYAFADPPERRLESGEKVAFPAAEQQVLRAIRYELADRGYFPTEDPRQVQFLISAHVGSRTTTFYVANGTSHMEGYDQWFQKWGVRGGTITPHTFTSGTLVIDFVDPASGVLVWHGWTTVGLRPEEDMRDTVRRAVHEVLALFPPR